MKRRIYILGAVAFALIAVLFVVILLSPDRGYSKQGYGWMTIWALAMSGVGFFLARREGLTSRRQ
jgi:hypothetical protein